MKYTTFITARALADLKEIHSYIARDSPKHADRFVGRILDKIELLSSAPDGFGRALESDLVSYELRQMVVAPYRVLYRVQGKRVFIVHVRHAARHIAGRQELG